MGCTRSLPGTRAPTATCGTGRDRVASAVAEPAFFVRRSEPRTVDCVTGMLDGDHEFASHGHTMRLRIALADAAAARCAPAGAPRDQGVIVQRS
jgi:hypothetical protein